MDTVRVVECDGDDGLAFERHPDGSVEVVVEPNGRPEIRFKIAKDHWHSLIANLSYYGEADYGFYRAANFHSGQPICPTNPIKDKPMLW